MTRTPELLMDLLPRLFLDLALVLLVLLGSSLHRCRRTRHGEAVADDPDLAGYQTRARRMHLRALHRVRRSDPPGGRKNRPLRALW